MVYTLFTSLPTFYRIDTAILAQIGSVITNQLDYSILPVISRPGQCQCHWISSNPSSFKNTLSFSVDALMLAPMSLSMAWLAAKSICASSCARLT